MIKLQKNRRVLRKVAAGMAVSMALMGTGCSKDRPNDPGALEKSSEAVVETTTEDITEAATEIETEITTEPETTDIETIISETESEIIWESDVTDDTQPEETSAPLVDDGEDTSVIDMPEFTIGIFIEEEENGATWKYFAENKTDKSIKFGLYDIYKNGLRLSDYMDDVEFELDGGEKITGIISDDIWFGCKIECKYWVNSYDLWKYSPVEDERGNCLFCENKNDLIQYPEEPVVLPFENDNLKIEMDNIIDENVDGTDMKVIKLSICNKYNWNRYYKIKDIIINGIHFSSDATVIANLLEANKWLVDDLYIPKIELERLGIEKIEEIILKMELYDENICELIDRFYVVAYPEGEDGKHFEEIKSTRVPDNVVDNELFRFEAFKEKNEYGCDVIKYRFENKSDMILGVPIPDFEVNGKMINRSLDFGCIYANKGESVEGTLDILSRFDVEEIKTLSFELVVNSNLTYAYLSRGRLGDYLIVL